MENLLTKIKELVEAYNNLPGSEEVAVVPKSYATDMNIPIKEEEIDVSTYYICVYDDEQVGLFKELRHSTGKEIVMGAERYESGSLFIGVRSNLIGMHTTHEGFNIVSNWRKVGTLEIVDQKRYVCSCEMYEAIPFDDIRLLMYESGELPTYTLGKATEKDLINVLKFAHQYFKDKIVSPKEKIKELKNGKNQE